MRENEHSPENEDPLEALLRSAAWAEPERERLNRLRQRWHLVSASRRRQREILRAASVLAIAAGVTIAVLVDRIVAPRTMPPVDPAKLAVTPPNPRPVSSSGEHPTAPEPTGQPAGNKEANRTVVARGAVPASRPATEYEKLILRLHTIQRRSTSPPAEAGVLEKLIDQLAGNEAADLEQLVRPLLADRPRCEQQLAERIGQLQGPRREAAIRLLGYVGSEQSLPLLEAQAADPSTRAVALLAAARLADPRSLAHWAIHERDLGLQEELLAGLLARGDPASLKIYLHLVEDSGPVAAAALMAVRSVEQPPVEELFACLEGTRLADRRAAAKVLGQIDGAQITERLIAMASRGMPCQEILTALVYRPDETAQQFLAQARRSPMLFGSLLAVSKQVRELPPSGMPIRTLQ